MHHCSHYTNQALVPSLTSFKDLSDLLERCAKYTQLYTVGDINMHLDNPLCTHACRLKQLMSDFELCDAVQQPTHISKGVNHQLDIFVTHDSCHLTSIVIHPQTLSDYALIVATVDMHTSVAAPPRPRIRRRCWDACNASFVDELNKSRLMCNPPTDVDELFDCYNCTISDILDWLAPFADIKLYGRTVSPWYDRECDQTQDAQARESVQMPSEPISLNTLVHTVQSTTVTVPEQVH